MKRILSLLGFALVVLVGVVAFRTLRYGSAQPVADPVAEVAIPRGAAERLAGSVRIQTISHEDSAAFDAGAFQALHAYLEEHFPRVHSEVRRETVAMHSLLYTWPGTDSSLKPILLMGHLDVVPVEPGTEDEWQQPPFSGRIADGFVWGRGSIDNKFTVLGTMV